MLMMMTMTMMMMMMMMIIIIINNNNNITILVRRSVEQLNKEIEKEDAIAQTQVTVTRTFKDDQGVEQTVQEQKPKAICVRFLMHMVEQLAERAPKNWRKFDAFMDIFFGFMVNSANEVYADKDEYDAESDAYKTGIELYFIYNMI